MAKQNRTTLKGYFETGDVPNQNQYGELIDSQLNLEDTSLQIAAGEISASGFAAENHISASGNISASGDFIGVSASLSMITASGNITSYGGTGSFGRLTAAVYSDIYVSGHITASGNIISSGSFTISTISSSNVLSTGYISGSNLISENHITASGNISASGYISASAGAFGTIDTGQGAFELGQDVLTTSAVTFATVNTGQGANELYDMDQNVLRTSTPEFTSLKITGKTDSTAYTWDANATVNSAAFALLTNFPTILSNENSDSQTITNSKVLASSVIMASCQIGLEVVCHTVVAGSFKFYLINSDKELASTLGGTEGLINFVVL